MRSNIHFTDEAKPRESTGIHLKYYDSLVDDYLLGSQIYVGHLPILISYTLDNGQRIMNSLDGASKFV